MKIFKEINPRFFAIFIRNQIFQLESNSIRILTYEDLPRESSTNHSTENARCWKGILFDIQHFHRIFFPTEIYLPVYFSANVYNINIISLSNTSRPFRRWRRKFRFLDQQGGREGGGTHPEGNWISLMNLWGYLPPPGGAEWIMETEINFFVSDDSNVPPSKRHNLHRACLASRDWIFPHLRRSHAQDLAVSKV